MIQTSTVLILGAGASKPYGYPTGAELRELILSELERGYDLYDRLWPNEKHVSPELVRAFRYQFGLSQLPSIDEFLEHNLEEWGQFGRAIIAGALLPYENLNELVRRPQLRWYDYLWDTLRGNIDDFMSHQLSIISFNYDRSLETYLANGMELGYNMSRADVTECLSHLRFVHVYGTLGGRAFIDKNARPYAELGADADTLTQIIHNNARDIKIVDRAHPDDVDEEFTEARQLISAAQRIFLLGFGFNETNLLRLNLRSIVQSNTQMRVIATTHGMGRMAVQRAKQFLNLGDQFTTHNVECEWLFHEYDALV